MFLTSLLLNKTSLNNKKNYWITTVTHCILAVLEVAHYKCEFCNQIIFHFFQWTTKVTHYPHLLNSPSSSDSKTKVLSIDRDTASDLHTQSSHSFSLKDSGDSAMKHAELSLMNERQRGFQAVICSHYVWAWNSSSHLT